MRNGISKRRYGSLKSSGDGAGLAIKHEHEQKLKRMEKFYNRIFRCTGLYIDCQPRLYFFAARMPVQSLDIASQLEKAGLTLNVCQALLQDLVEGLRVFELFPDLGNNRIGELLLLLLLELVLVADP